MSKILVVGGYGQLGLCLQKISENYQLDYDIKFVDSKTCDITNISEIETVFEDFKPKYCINAAAYTAVDLAESEEEIAFAVNAYGVENLAQVCKQFKTTLLHISTDYVFDGEINLDYSEDDFTNPQSVYGKSKLLGEELALEANPKTIVIRTSWLYSEFQKNFVKTMLNLFEQKDELNIVADQYGQPTNATDLAEAIFKIIKSKNKRYGIYHFSNYPETTWYDFAKKIADYTQAKIKLNPIPTEKYPTPAQRPKRSTMCLDKIESDYKVEIKYWENSLEECLDILKNKTR